MIIDIYVTIEVQCLRAHAVRITESHDASIVPSTSVTSLTTIMYSTRESDRGGITLGGGHLQGGEYPPRPRGPPRHCERGDGRCVEEDDDGHEGEPHHRHLHWRATVYGLPR